MAATPKSVRKLIKAAHEYGRALGHDTTKKEKLKLNKNLKRENTHPKNAEPSQKRHVVNENSVKSNKSDIKTKTKGFREEAKPKKIKAAFEKGYYPEPTQKTFSMEKTYIKKTVPKNKVKSSMKELKKTYKHSR
jgi:SLT domain-containing protein